MNSISPAELASIQADLAAILDKSCTIKRKTRTADGLGSFTESWATIATVMVGMAQPTAGQLANYDYLIGSLASWQVKFPVGTDVQHQDRLLIGSDTLEVQVNLGLRSYPGLLTVLASEVK